MPDEISLRRFREDDLPTLIELFRDTIRRVNVRDYTPEQVQAWAPDEIDPSKWRTFEGRHAIVAEFDGRIVGFADLETDGHLDRFFVHADMQRRGVGRAMLEALLDEAGRLALPRIFAEVSVTALPFFERHGFVVLERLRDNSSASWRGSVGWVPSRTEGADGGSVFQRVPAGRSRGVRRGRRNERGREAIRRRPVVGSTDQAGAPRDRQGRSGQDSRPAFGLGALQRRHPQLRRREPGRLSARDRRGPASQVRALDDLHGPQAAGAVAKKKTLAASEQQRPDVAEARDAWRKGQPSLDPSGLVFLDETWTKTNMTRTYARSARGTRAYGSAPHGHWKTTTFLAGLRSTGLVAPLVVDGAIDGDLFVAYVRTQLAPVLREGDVVILDNLSSHKRIEAREAIEAVGARLWFLPPYSPDLNPIEMAFSKLKRMLRDAEERTVEGLWRLCGRLVDRFRPDECRNYLAHCGYRYD